MQMGHYKKVLLALWGLITGLALGVSSLIVYLLTEVFVKERPVPQKLFLSTAAPPGSDSPVPADHHSLAASWQLNMGLAAQKSLPKPKMEPAAPPPVPQACPLDKHLRLIACAVDTDPGQSYCVLEHTGSGRQILVGEEHVIQPLNARVVRIEAQSIKVVYQNRVWQLVKKTAGENLTVVTDQKPSDALSATAVTWIDQVLTQAQFETSAYGVGIKDPAGFRQVGLKPGDLLLTMNGKPIRQKEELAEGFKEKTAQPFWSLTFKRNGETIDLMIWKKK